MKKSIIWVVLLSLVALVVVIILRRSSPPLSSPRPSTSDLTVGFGGFTNTAKGAAAVFLLSNATPKAILFQVADVEQRTDSGWQSMPLTEANSFVDTSGQP